MPRSLSPEATFEGSADAVSHTIVQRIAELTEREATQLPPLYEAVDPDALDRLVDSVSPAATSLSIQFTYAGRQVTVDADGTVRCSDERDARSESRDH